MKKDKEEIKREFKARLYQFVLQVIKFVSQLPKDRACFIISDQLLRSSTSILANYIESQSASSKKEFLLTLKGKKSI